MKQTIIYARWSSQEQSGGTTLERQIQNCTKFALERGFGECEIVTDQGVSAYTGANIRSGNLSKLVKDFIYGRRDPHKTIILVEELDRLTRADAPTAFAWINQVLSQGVTIMVQTSGKTLDAELLRNDIGALMALVMENFNSNFESKKKARRIAAYWEITRKKGEVNPNMRHPSWLEVQNGELVPIQGAKEIIEQMFEMAGDGHGSTAIAKALNDAKVKPWAGTKRQPLYWTPAKVRRVVYNDAIIGYYTPFLRPRGGTAQRAGPKILRYPPMVSQEQFNAVVGAKKASTGGRGNSVTNLIPKIARCSKCGGAMGARGSVVKGHYYLYCLAAKSGGGLCDHKKGWSYFEIEFLLLDHLLQFAVSDDAFADKNDGAALLLSRQLSELKSTIHTKTDHLKVLLKRMTGDHGAEVEEVYEEVSGELSKAKAEAEKVQSLLDQRRGKATSPAQHVKRVMSIKDQMYIETDPNLRNNARRIARDALAQLLDTVTFDPVTGYVEANLAGGVGKVVLDRYAMHQYVMHKGKDISNHPNRDVIGRWVASHASISSN